MASALVAGQAEPIPVPCGHGLKAVRLLSPLLKVSRRDDVTRAVPLAEMLVHHHQLARIAKRQRLEQDILRDGEQRGGRDEARGYPQHGNAGEPRRSEQRADSLTQAAPELLQPEPASVFARLVPQECGVAEGTQRSGAGCVGSHSGCLEFGGLQIDMESQLAVEPLFEVLIPGAPPAG
jgi:hypothetical protein